MTRGFMDTGRFELVYANDNNVPALQSYRANFDPEGRHSNSGDIISIVEKTPENIPQADIVIGGPPWQVQVVESLDGGISEEMTEETVCIYREWLGEAIKVRRNHEAE